MTHQDQCAEILATLEAAAGLVARIGRGDANAAEHLKQLCERRSYEGYVLHVRMDNIIGYAIDSQPHLWKEGNEDA